MSGVIEGLVKIDKGWVSNSILLIVSKNSKKSNDKRFVNLNTLLCA